MRLGGLLGVNNSESKRETTRKVTQAFQPVQTPSYHLSEISRPMYRLVLPTYFGPGTPIGDALPRLTPEKGTTPDAAAIVGAWDAVAEQGVVTAQIPVQDGLKKARLLYSPGATWDADAASPVETKTLVGVNLADPLIFTTAFALSTPGSHALFRVEIENETGNVATSNIVNIVRV